MINKFRTNIINYFKSKHYNIEDIEDAIQITLLRIINNPPPKTTKSYVIQAVQWELVKIWKKNKSFNFTDVGLEQKNILAKNKIYPEDLLDGLKPRTRRALYMRYWEDASRKEIANALGIGEHGAKNVLQRGKQKLKELIDG